MFETLWFRVFFSLFSLGCVALPPFRYSLVHIFSVLSSICNLIHQNTQKRHYIPVTILRLCKRILIERWTSEREKGSFAHRFRFSDIHWCIDCFRLCPCSQTHSFSSYRLLSLTISHFSTLLSHAAPYIFGQISWLDQIKRKLKVKRTPNRPTNGAMVTRWRKFRWAKENILPINFGVWTRSKIRKGIEKFTCMLFILEFFRCLSAYHSTENKEEKKQQDLFGYMVFWSELITKIKRIDALCVYIYMRGKNAGTFCLASKFLSTNFLLKAKINTNKWSLGCWFSLSLSRWLAFFLFSLPFCGHSQSGPIPFCRFRKWKELKYFWLLCFF